MITEQQALDIVQKFCDEPAGRGIGISLLHGELLAAFREVERITAEACAALDVNMDATEQEHAGEARGFHAGVNAYRRAIRAMLPAPNKKPKTLGDAVRDARGGDAPIEKRGFA